MFLVISVYFNIRNTLPKSGTFLLGHLVYGCMINNFAFNTYNNIFLITTRLSNTVWSEPRLLVLGLM